MKKPFTSQRTTLIADKRCYGEGPVWLRSGYRAMGVGRGPGGAAKAPQNQVPEDEAL